MPPVGGELALFQTRYQCFQLAVSEFAGILFKYGFHGLGWGRVKKNGGCNIFTKGLCDAGQLLRQHPHADGLRGGQKSRV